MTSSSDRVTQFLAISSVLTAFDRGELQGTGLVDVYLHELAGTIGEEALDRFLLEASAIVDRRAPIEREILAHARLGPLARNLIRMWYLGSWHRLPDDWYVTSVRGDKDVDRVLSPQAYVEGLVWRVIDSHPPAAKAPGFGSWALAPGPRGGAK
jgi:hypothetical protein